MLRFFLGFNGPNWFCEEAFALNSRRLSLGTALLALAAMVGRAKSDGAFCGAHSRPSLTLLSENTSRLSLVFRMTASLGRISVVTACLSRAR